MISPLLANVYLPYVVALWADPWRHRTAQGEAAFVRYAGDIVAGVRHEADATVFLAERLAMFALSLHPKKTRVLAFGRFAAERRTVKGLESPETLMLARRAMDKEGRRRPPEMTGTVDFGSNTLAIWGIPAKYELLKVRFAAKELFAPGF